MERRHVVTAVYSAYACCHYYLAIFQFDYMGSIPSHMITYPLLLVALGCIWDNMRLATGAFWGARAVPEFSAHVSYFLHLAVLPALFSTYSHILALVLKTEWLQYPGTMLSVVLCSQGIRTYFSRVHGQLELEVDEGIARYRLPQKKKDPSLIFPVMLIGLGGVVTGAGTWAATGRPGVLLSQGACFLGQALVPGLPPTLGATLSNALEVLFLYSLMTTQDLLIEAT